MDVGRVSRVYRGGYWGPTGRGGHIALSWPFGRLELTDSTLRVSAARGLGWCFQSFSMGPDDGCVIRHTAMTLDFTPSGGEPFFFYSFASAEIARRAEESGYRVASSR